MAWGHTRSLKVSPGHGASPDPATAMHNLVALRTSPGRGPVQLCAATAKPENPTCPQASALSWHRLSGCAGTGWGRWHSLSPLCPGLGRPSPGLGQNKGKHGPEPCDNKWHWGPAASASVSSMLHSQQGHV